MLHRRIERVMTAPVVTVRPDTPYKAVAELLAAHRISGLPVVDADGAVLGVISETDLMARQVLAEEQWLNPSRGHGRPLTRAARTESAKAQAQTARELMSAPPVTVHSGAGVVEAARTMARHHVERLPVIDDEHRLVGIVTRRDLLSVFLRTDAEIRSDIVEEVVVRTLWLAPKSIMIDVADGVVTLTGRLERNSQVADAVRMTQQVDGVVRVVNRLDHTLDDELPRLSQETQEWLRTL
ncbi:CBS domain-containing protein [Streptacidiphilus sp. EB129]|uniref:CBS domain-containing protein n=1 Tax=Streptacidiphilus sp. EB129 TaxID=3156262 RepID=UPI003516862A